MINLSVNFLRLRVAVLLLICAGWFLPATHLQADDTAIWPDAVTLQDGWKWSSWFGYFSDASFPWVYHNEHGWMYVDASSPADMWLYSTQMGWLWTGANTYPNLYRASDNAWLWYQLGSTQPEWFYNYSTQAWENGVPASQLTAVAITDPNELAVALLHDQTGESSLLLHAEKDASGNVTRLSGFTRLHRDPATQRVDAWQTTVLGTNGLPQQILDSTGSSAMITSYGSSSCQVDFLDPSGTPLATNVTVPLAAQFFADFATYASLTDPTQFSGAQTAVRKIRKADLSDLSLSSIKQALTLSTVALLPANWVNDIVKASPNLEQLAAGVLNATTVTSAGKLLFNSGLSAAAVVVDVGGVDKTSAFGFTVTALDHLVSLAGAAETVGAIGSIAVGTAVLTPAVVVGALSSVVFILSTSIEVSEAIDYLENGLTSAQTDQLDTDLNENGTLNTEIGSLASLSMVESPGDWDLGLANLDNAVTILQQDVPIAAAASDSDLPALADDAETFSNDFTAVSSGIKSALADDDDAITEDNELISEFNADVVEIQAEIQAVMDDGDLDDPTEALADLNAALTEADMGIQSLQEEIQQFQQEEADLRQSFAKLGDMLQ